MLLSTTHSCQSAHSIEIIIKQLAIRKHNEFHKYTRIFRWIFLLIASSIPACSLETSKFLESHCFCCGSLKKAAQINLQPETLNQTKHQYIFMCTADEVNPPISRASFNSLTSATTLPPFSMCQSLTVTGRPKSRTGPLNYFG